MESPKIIIVGAGVAGIAAASRLLSKGMTNVTLLEAENRIGGRVNTVDFGDSCVDLGAQWVHGEGGNVVYSIANPLGLLDNKTEALTKAQCFLSNGVQLDLATSHQLYNICWEILYEVDRMREFEGSLGEYFNSRFQEIVYSEGKIKVTPSLADSFLNWYQKFQNSIDGPDSWFETSARGLEEYWECDGNLMVKWKNGGYSNIIDLLMKKYPNPEEELPVKEKTLLNKEVKSVSWEGQDGVKLICGDGSSYCADHVVITVSLGVLKESATTLFTPSLPNIKSNAIKGLDIGTVNKIFVKFPYRWWPDDCPGFSLLWDQLDEDSSNDDSRDWVRDVFGFYSIDNNPTVLCGWIVGSSSRHMELCTDQQVKESCQQLLQRFLGQKFTIPQIDIIKRSQWHSNPHFRGSYSFRSLKSDHMKATAAELADPLTVNGKLVVQFAGEATHDHYYSTVHGALETGWREADRILSLYQKSLKSSL